MKKIRQHTVVDAASGAVTLEHLADQEQGRAGDVGHVDIDRSQDGVRLFHSHIAHRGGNALSTHAKTRGGCG